MFDLITVQLVDLKQIKEKLSPKFFKELNYFLEDEFSFGSNDDTLVKVDRFIDCLRKTLSSVEEYQTFTEEDEESVSPKELKELKKQVKSLIQELRELPAGVAVALGS